MYDIIIIGGGVSGSYIASRLGKHFNVLVIERQKQISPRDSGIVSRRIFNFIGRRYLIKSQLHRMNIISPSGIELHLDSDEPFAYLLERERFSYYLRHKAQKNADVTFENVRSVSTHTDKVIVNTENNEYTGKIAIGADGTNSIVRNCLGIYNPAFCYGLMCRSNESSDGNVNVFFNKYFSPDFFSWVIPQNHEYGLMTASRPKEYLEFFKKYFGFSDGNCYGYPIPIGYTKSYGCRSLLVGDACGQTKPITGGGIIFSLIAAHHAITTIKKAFGKNNFSEKFFSRYEKLWRCEYGREIERQTMARLVYRKMTNKDIDKLFKTAVPIFGKINNFDYDNLSRLWTKMPKTTMAKFAIELIKCIF